jgi:hypothetical protein
MEPGLLRAGVVPTVSGIAFMALAILCFVIAASGDASRRDQVWLMVLGLLMGFAAAVNLGSGVPVLVEAFKRMAGW